MGTSLERNVTPEVTISQDLFTLASRLQNKHSLMEVGFCDMMQFDSTRLMSKRNTLVAVPARTTMQPY